MHNLHLNNSTRNGGGDEGTMALRSLALQLGGRMSLEPIPAAVSCLKDMLRLNKNYIETVMRTICSSTVVSKSPAEAGGPPKGFSSMKRRFKVTGSGAIRCMSPGFVHKRFNKSNKRLNRLSKGILVPPTYEKMMKKLGFVSRRF